MKVFTNREIRNLFRTVLAVWAVALALTQGVAWHTTHAFSFGSLFVFLLLGGCPEPAQKIHSYRKLFHSLDKGIVMLLG